LQNQHAFNFLSSFLQFKFNSLNEYLHLHGEGVSLSSLFSFPAMLQHPAGFAGTDTESALPFLSEEGKQTATCVMLSRQG